MATLASGDADHQGPPPTIGDLVHLAEVETVVRLDGPRGMLAELVLTGDAAAALDEVLEAARGPAGAGFFVVGPFGSGKSHFLAAVAELLAGPGPAQVPASWAGALRQAATAARRCLAVRVPLVDYRAEPALEDVVRARACHALGLGVPAGGADRVEYWNYVLAAARTAGHGGLVLLVDEASEWLRAKRGAALTEDLRFLQFLGEWARQQPVVVLVALQEDIEEVANVSEKELVRIRDRYGVVRLSMRHVEDLVRGRLVGLKPGADLWVDKVAKDMAASFPGTPHDLGRLARCYPLHPGTLDVLEGLRFLLSQNRGVVDFVCRQVRVDLDKPRTALVTPDRIYDHFSERLHERRESARLADTVLPYYERAVTEIFDAADRPLALRTVKLLCLLAASPLERPRSANELAAMLLAKVSDLDPAANAAYLAEVVLGPLVARGAYVVANPGAPVTYSVQVGADAAVMLDARLRAARSELSEMDRRMVTTLVELGSTPSLPLDLMANVGFARRELLWQNTLRWVTTGLARVADMVPAEAGKLVEQARGCGAEGVIVVAEVELGGGDELVRRAVSLAAVTERAAIWVPAAPSPEELDIVADLHSRRLVREQALSEGHPELVELLDRSRDADRARARELLRRLYFAGSVVTADYSSMPAAPDLPSLAGLSFDRQLPALAGPLLSRLHPGHARIAPRGELVGQRYLRQLVGEVIAAGRLGAPSLERGGLRGLVEGYLVPLGLARLRKDGMALAPDPARSTAVAEALHLVGDDGPVPAVEVVTALADGPLGLTEPEALLVLNACAQAGLVEVWRGRKKVTETFLTLTRADRLGPGELVEPALREAVAALSPVISGPGPFEPWTAGTQRQSWEYAQTWLQARREDVAQVRAGLARLAESAALAGADSSTVRADVGVAEGVLAACDQVMSPAQGLRAIVSAAGEAAGGPLVMDVGGGAAELLRADVGEMVAAGKRLAALARFFRDDLHRMDEAVSYLTSPELVVPDDDAALASLRSAALGTLPDLLLLAATDRLGELASANREFRSAYAAAYQQAHERHYSAISPDLIGKVRDSPMYRALAALSGSGAVAVPDDRVKVERMLASAVPAPCTRRVDSELSWKPRCGCGFALGDPVPALDTEALLAVAARGVRQHLSELSTPPASHRLVEATAQLHALGREELAVDLERLLEVASATGPPDPLIVTSLLGHDLQMVLSDVLSGGQLIVARDLAELREDLIGRRYPKRRLVELLAAWVDPSGTMPAAAFVEVVDSSEAGGTGAAGRTGPGRLGPPASPTVGFLQARFPGLAAALPAQQPADAFWLAAWWAGRPLSPGWVPSSLVEDPRTVQAAEAARAAEGALRELSDLDGRTGPGTVLGGQVEAALGLASAAFASVVSTLSSERLLRYPLALAGDQLARRLAADWQATKHVGDLDLARLAAEHFLVGPEEIAALGHLIEAARHLAEVERRLAVATCVELVEDLYPGHVARVAELVSRASLANAGRSVLGPGAVEEFRAGAHRVLAAAGTAFASFAGAGFPGCLHIADVGRVLVGPLLAAHGRVAVVIVDAMRADAARVVASEFSRALPERRPVWHWAVVEPPTRTAEAMAALALGRPVPGGSAFPGGGHSLVPPAGARSAHRHEAEPWPAPFGHLGYEVALLKQADRDHSAQELHDLWASPSPVMVAVATALDERLHHSSVELAVLLDDASRAISQRALASLATLPPSVPIVLMADHGFRENPSWGKGPEGRYVHGGMSLEECVVPIIVAT